MELSMRSRRELTVRQARRYRLVSRTQKGRILYEFEAATCYSRDQAAMLLRGYGRYRVQSRGASESVRLVATTACTMPVSPDVCP